MAPGCHSALARGPFAALRSGLHELEKAPHPGVGRGVALVRVGRQQVAVNKPSLLAVDTLAALHAVGEVRCRRAALQRRVVKFVRCEAVLGASRV